MVSLVMSCAESHLIPDTSLPFVSGPMSCLRILLGPGAAVSFHWRTFIRVTVSTLYYQPCSYWWPGDTFGLSIQECFFSAGQVDHFMTEFLGSNSHWYLWGPPPSTAVVTLTSYFSHHPVSPRPQPYAPCYPRLFKMSSESQYLGKSQQWTFPQFT